MVEYVFPLKQGRTQDFFRGGGRRIGIKYANKLKDFWAHHIIFNLQLKPAEPNPIKL